MNKSKIYLILSMLIFGSIGLFRVYIPLGSATLAALRGFGGALSMFIIMRVTKRKMYSDTVKKNLPRLIVSGILLGINWMLLFEAYNYTTVSVATLCYYMAPIFVIVVSPFLLGEKMTLKKVICVIAAAVGMVLISGVLNIGEKPSAKGVLYGLGAALIYAAIIVINKKITDIDAYSKTGFQLFWAAIATMPYALINEKNDLSSLSLTAVIFIIIVCVIHTGVAYALYFSSMEKLSVQTVALFSYIDPTVAVLGSFLILKQHLGIAEIIGVILILAVSAIAEIKPKRKQ